MNRKNKINIVAGFVLSMMSVAVLASNCGFLSNSPMSFFTKEDVALTKKALSKALNHSRDGAKVAWHNPHTGSYGLILPSRTTHANGSVCRHLKVMNSANLVHEDMNYTFCKMQNEWKIV